MPSIITRLKKNNKLDCPWFLEDNIHYETLMGSHAYGCNDPDKSDYDVYGFCIPPKDIIFPHLAGSILGFDTTIKKFDQFQQPHIINIDDGREYDINCYNIVKYFRLCADCNPNMIDSLFTPATCVLHSTKIGNLVKENRKIFLSKKAWHTFKGYAYSQLHAATAKKFEHSKRKEEVDKYGYSVKYAYHLVRLMDEVEMILLEGDIDLQRNKEQYKSIRRGERTLEDIRNWFSAKESGLEKLYLESNAVPHLVQEGAIKSLLINCLEEQYGSFSEIVKVSNSSDDRKILEQIKNLVKFI